MSTALAVLIAGIAAVALACSGGGRNEDEGTPPVPLQTHSSTTEPRRVTATEIPATRQAEIARVAAVATVYARRPPGLPTVATVNGTPVPADFLFMGLVWARFPDALGAPTSTARDLVQNEVRDELMFQEAERRGLGAQCTEENVKAITVSNATAAAEGAPEIVAILAAMRGVKPEEWTSDPLTIEGYRRGCLIAALRGEVQSEAGQTFEELTPGVLTTETQALRDFQEQLEAHADVRIDEDAIAEVERAVDQAFR